MRFFLPHASIRRGGVAVALGSVVSLAPLGACVHHTAGVDVTGWDSDAAIAPVADAAFEAMRPMVSAPPPPTLAAAKAARDACAFTRGAMPAATLGDGVPIGKQLPVEHIVVLVQENRSFDQYFSHLARYEARRGLHNVIEGEPRNASNPSVPIGFVAGDAGASALVTGLHFAVHAPRLCIVDTPHDWLSMHVDHDQGRNDGFYFVNNGHGGPGGNLNGIAPNLTSGDRALWWYDERDIPFYYELYSTFGMADHYHSDVLGPTFPNRMYLYGATSFGQTDNYNPDLGPYPFPGNSPALIFDELQARHVTWALYAESPPASTAVLGVTFKDRYGFEPAKSFQSFLDDAAAGTLPAVSFLDADFAHMAANDDDEHPPADIELGQHFVWSVVNAVTNSPTWSSTVLFVTYDEAGGFYDHVAPPQACRPDSREPVFADPASNIGLARFDHLGFRVPLVVVSPYVKRGFVSHATYSHASITRFIESRLDGPALSARDANADPFTDMFDWQNPPFVTPPAFPEPKVDQAAVALCQADLTPTP